MHHWVLRTAFAGLALWLLFAAWAQQELRAGAPLPAGQSGGERVLILYDETGATSEIEAALAGNLAGRFGRAQFRSFAQYRRGDLRAYDAAIVIAAGAAPPAGLLQDVRVARRPVAWIGGRIGSLFEDREFAAAQGWRPAAPAPANWTAIYYRGMDFPRDLRVSAPAAVPVISDPARAETLATATARGGEQAVWAVRSGNLFYLAETPFAYAHEDDRYLAFADLLFVMLAPETPARHRAMVRIDGVGPDSNPRRIRALADLMAGEGIPFSIAVYDTYRDPSGRFSGGRPIGLSLAQRPQIVSALRYAMSRGATLVALGHTHQTDTRDNPYARVSGGDFEFFAADLAGGTFALLGPLPDNDAAQWRERFEASARAWSRTGLGRPHIFATPFNAASAEAYEAARDFYAARYERSLYFAGEIAAGRAEHARGWTSQFFPYEAVDLRGDFIIPENLGAFSRASGRTAERVIASARRNLAVRDGFASFSFPWSEDPAALREAITGVKRLGYRFVAPAEVVRDAPAHAAGPLHRASPLAAASARWVRALPPLDLFVVVALLGLVAAMWLIGEAALRLVPAQPQRGFRLQRAA